jgi:hypothetical protein
VRAPPWARTRQAARREAEGDTVLPGPIAAEFLTKFGLPKNPRNRRLPRRGLPARTTPAPGDGRDDDGLRHHAHRKVGHGASAYDQSSFTDLAPHRIRDFSLGADSAVAVTLAARPVYPRKLATCCNAQVVSVRP